ncbi:MFS transporter [Natrarchaeobius halalkaliphilus]|uniref:MFS transporter n=1 Tax=Natrarchaeobius halalkaliphilus TaxID=1679091 RepID=A0A3N6LYR0_9EURY|nr:MFS transporter [Natrarchaeobius halalkaliphilus]RQG87813.1 MFS transporter [Natrarchaeobius halalkaliphilus]
MFGLSGREVRFALVISGAHLGQHFLMRLIPPLIPVLAVALEYPLWQLGLLISLFSFGSGLAQAPLGIISDRYDRLYVLPTGITIAGAGYVLFAGATSLGAVVPGITISGYTFTGAFLVMGLAMLISGVGTAVVHPTGYPMITDNVSSDNKGKVLGVFGSSAKFGDAAAPAIVGVLILVLVWSQVLLILGLVGIVLGLLLFLVLRGDEYDTVPAAQQNPDGEDETPTETIWDADKRTYMYPLAIIYLFFVSKMFSGEGVKTFLPAFLVAVYAYSFELMDVQLGPESVANFYFAALLVFSGALQLVIGGITDRIDTRLILLGGISLAAVGFLALSLLELGPVSLLVALCLAGVGIYGLAPARDALISDISPPELEGRTFGYIWTAIMLTGAVMPPLVGYIMETMGMREGFLVLTGGTVVAAGFASLLFFERFYVTESPVHGEPNPSD